MMTADSQLTSSLNTAPAEPVTDFIQSNPRYQQPEGWRWHVFTNPAGEKLRFGTVSPKSRIPDAVVVILPGLSEFAEKYFEITHDLLDRNLAVWIMDWQGQGLSHRPLTNRHKRHSSGFDNDLADLHYFLVEYVKHASVHPDVGRIPMVMLAHSMGGNLGLRYLIDHPGMFSCAAFSAPMTGIAATNPLPLSIAVDIAGLLKEGFNMSYVFGGKDWSPVERDTPSKNIFSSDPVRARIHNAWCLKNPDLQVGNVTFGWLYEALRSCAGLHHLIKSKSIEVPCLFALAGQDKLIDNKATRKLIESIPQAKILELPDSLHEIMMERDSIRDQFLNTFATLLSDNKIREKLKPF
jgi:lysophospholipase